VLQLRWTSGGWPHFSIRSPKRLPLGRRLRSHTTAKIVICLFLAFGIRYGAATEVSLLLNFETVAITLLAGMIFHEHIGYQV